MRGILISNGIQDLANSRRSVIRDWYSGTLQVGADRLVQMKRAKLIQGAALRIVPNTQLFVAPPP